ncbi:MAG TPA: metallophosphoesterase [Vicinamibacteria bacterium]|nr:metallophosphoesterase [Vicinamibacteria bacterium]
MTAACGGGPNPPPLASPSPVPSPIAENRDILVAAAGDISCPPVSTASCEQMRTADLLTRIRPDLVLPLGDTQYFNGEYQNFLLMYEPSWGRMKGITRPAVGNHEYHTPGAQGYFDYFTGVGQFSGPAGERGFGWYSFNVGRWHVISLNSNCSFVGGCGPGSPQEQWLRADLRLNQAACTLAYLHHPLFSSGINGNQVQVRGLYQALYEGNADLVLTGHEHSYERFAPQAPDGTPDPARGLRQIVVGTGGYNLTAFREPALRNSEFRDNRHFGVLRLSLKDGGYAFQFVGIGDDVVDSGTGTCH